MKVLYFLLILVLAVTAIPLNENDARIIRPRGAFEDIFNNTIQSILDGLTEPITLENLELNFPDDSELLKGGLRVSGLEITGIKKLNMSYIKVDPFALQLTFTAELKSINIFTNYWADILVATLVPLYGEGAINVHLSNLKIEGTGKAHIFGGLSVSDIRIVVTLGASTFDVHGLLNDEGFSLIVSAILNNNVSRFINENQGLISDIVSPVAEAFINQILSGGGKSTTVQPKIEV